MRVHYLHYAYRESSDIGCISLMLPQLKICWEPIKILEMINDSLLHPASHIVQMIIMKLFTWDLSLSILSYIINF